MNVLYKLIAAALFLTLPAFSGFTKDFGLLIDQNGVFSGGAESDSDDLTKEYHGTLIPWFSAPLGDRAEVYISAGITANYEDSARYENEWELVPELLRTELIFRPNENGTLTAGRMSWADPLGFIANGLFDGARFTLDLADGSTVGAGLWYTGFLYKKNAHITITEADLAEYEEEVDYDDFAGTYFAPRRLVAAVEWEHPGIAELIRLRAALLGQFDFTKTRNLNQNPYLSGGDKRYHSQYLSVKAGVPVGQFVFELGGAVELAETAGDRLFSFAGEAGIGWSLPTSFADSLHLLGRFSTGTSGGGKTFTAFVPITTESHGYVLKEKISGLSMIKLDYTARLHQTLSLSLVNSYFVLSDLGTYQGRPYGRDGHFLGNELYGFAVWNPVSDIQIKAGGGVFLPSLGNADRYADVLWCVDLSIVLALF